MKLDPGALALQVQADMSCSMPYMQMNTIHLIPSLRPVIYLKSIRIVLQQLNEELFINFYHPDSASCPNLRNTSPENSIGRIQCEYVNIINESSIYRLHRMLTTRIVSACDCVQGEHVPAHINP